MREGASTRATCLGTAGDIGVEATQVLPLVGRDVGKDLAFHFAVSTPYVLRLQPATLV